MLNNKQVIREMIISDYEQVLTLWQTSPGMTLRESDSKPNIERYLYPLPFKMQKSASHEVSRF